MLWELKSREGSPLAMPQPTQSYPIMQFRFSIRKDFKGMILGIRKDADGPKTLKQFHVEADSLALPRLS